MLALPVKCTLSHPGERGSVHVPCSPPAPTLLGSALRHTPGQVGRPPSQSKSPGQRLSPGATADQDRVPDSLQVWLRQQTTAPAGLRDQAPGSLGSLWAAGPPPASSAWRPQQPCQLPSPWPTFCVCSPFLSSEFRSGDDQWGWEKVTK